MSLEKLTPTTVLYDLDGPVLYVSANRLLSLLCLKVDEGSSTDTILVSTVSQQIVDALRGGRLSVRGAFLSSDNAWLVDADPDFTIINSQPVQVDELEDGLLPMSGFGLAPSLGNSLPDILVDPRAIFSIYMRGEAFDEGKIALSKLKRSITASGNIIRKVLLPEGLRGVSPKTFDPIVSEPAFASFSISVMDTSFNIKNLQKNLKRKDFSDEDLRLLMNDGISSFMERVEDLRSRSVASNIADVGLFDIYDTLSEIMPSLETGIESVSFIAPGATKKEVAIRADEGVVIESVYGLRDQERSSLSGYIDQITDKSSAIRINRVNGKDIRCEFSDDHFRDIRDNENFRIGCFATVSGLFIERDKVDLLADAQVISLHKRRPS